MLETEPRDAIDIVFDALGATNGAATALDDVLVSALGADAARGPRGAAPAVRHVGSARVASTAVTLHAVGLATARVATARELLVVCDAGSGAPRRHRARGRRPSCARCRASIPTRGLHVVRVEHDVAPTRRSTTPRGSRPSRSAGARSRTRSPERAGRCSRSRARTRSERVQFGRPIASFQAVRHRLADALVAVEALDATLERGGRRTERPHRGARQGDRGPHGADGRDAIASRCSPGSASPPIIRFTASSSGRCCSTGCSVRPTRSRSTSAGNCSPPAGYRPSSSSDETRSGERGLEPSGGAHEDGRTPAGDGARTSPRRRRSCASPAGDGRCSSSRARARARARHRTGDGHDDHPTAPGRAGRGHVARAHGRQRRVHRLADAGERAAVRLRRARVRRGGDGDVVQGRRRAHATTAAGRSRPTRPRRTAPACSCAGPRTQAVQRHRDRRVAERERRRRRRSRLGEPPRGDRAPAATRGSACRRSGSA